MVGVGVGSWFSGRVSPGSPSAEEVKPGYLLFSAGLLPSSGGSSWLLFQRYLRSVQGC